MAQTKRKRRTKHRGTAGGTVVSRGRTGRKLTEAERKKNAQSTGKGQRTAARLARYDKPPTWKGSFTKGGIGTVFFVLFVVVIFKQPAASAAGVALFVFVLYSVLTYYTDLFVYRRRQKRKAAS